MNPVLSSSVTLRLVTPYVAIPLERLTLSALIATLLKRCGNWYQAASRLEKVCDLALELDPDASQTIGDLCDLAECYQALDKLQEALSALQRARPICQRVLPEFLTTLDTKIEALRKELGTDKTSLELLAQIRASVECSSVNYSLEHAGISSITSLKVMNDNINRRIASWENLTVTEENAS